MAGTCTHTNETQAAAARTDFCEECVQTGSRSVALRLCRTCGHVGCCDSSSGRHARAHFNNTGHPIIEPHGAPKTWAWCYVDEIYLDPKLFGHGGQ